ncbi:MAG: hypothetical protein GXO64_01060, partial [Candidatus Micrarchaeota archaeon]|nr:hypothetical protein [Candidatus Micrarchaeota archaeon]
MEVVIAHQILFVFVLVLALLVFVDVAYTSDQLFTSACVKSTINDIQNFRDSVRKAKNAQEIYRSEISLNKECVGSVIMVRSGTNFKGADNCPHTSVPGTFILVFTKDTNGWWSQTKRLAQL